VTKRVATFADTLLRERELLVTEHPRQKGRPLGPRCVGEDGQFLLAREVGVEKLVVRHTEHALQPPSDFLQGVGNDCAVLIQLGTIQAAFHSIRMATERELELDAHRRARFRAQIADGIFIAARRRIAVDRPRDPLQQRRLAGAVGTDDTGDAVAEHNFGIRVLAEIDEPHPL
jgi:hypothetical protein